MLPLIDVLEENTHIKKLNLASSGMHDARYVEANFNDFGLFAHVNGYQPLRTIFTPLRIRKAYD